MKYLDNIEGFSCYLAGPIDRTDDDGVQWRKRVKQKCEDRKIPIKFFDPTDKPKGLGSEIGEEKIRVQQLLDQKRWPTVEVKRFKRFDHKMLDKSDLFVINIDPSVHACGSYCELTWAELEKKPMFAIMAEGYTKYQIPAWLVDVFDEEEVFETIDEFVDHLELLHKGKIAVDTRWVKLLI